MDVSPVAKDGGGELPAIPQCNGSASEHKHKAIQCEQQDNEAAARPDANAPATSRSISEWLQSCASSVLHDRMEAVEAKQHQLDNMVGRVATLGHNITSRLSQFDHIKATINNLNNEIRAIGVSAVQAKIMDTIDDQMDGNVIKRLEATCASRVSPAKSSPVGAAAATPANGAKRRRVDRPAAGRQEQRDDDAESVITVSSDEGDAAHAAAATGVKPRPSAAQSDTNRMAAQQRQRTNAWVVGGGSEAAASSSAAQALLAANAASAAAAPAPGGSAAAASGPNECAPTSDVVELTQAHRVSPHTAAKLRPQLHLQHRPDRLVLTMCWPHGESASLLKQYQVVYARADNGTSVAADNTQWDVVRKLPICNGAVPKTAHVTKNERGSYFLGARAVLHNGMCTMTAYERVDC